MPIILYFYIELMRDKMSNHESTVALVPKKVKCEVEWSEVK